MVVVCSALSQRSCANLSELRSWWLASKCRTSYWPVAGHQGGALRPDWPEWCGALPLQNRHRGGDAENASPAIEPKVQLGLWGALELVQNKEIRPRFEVKLPNLPHRENRQMHGSLWSMRPKSEKEGRTANVRLFLCKNVNTREPV